MSQQQFIPPRSYAPPGTPAWQSLPSADDSFVAGFLLAAMETLTVCGEESAQEYARRHLAALVELGYVEEVKS